MCSTSCSMVSAWSGNPRVDGIGLEEPAPARVVEPLSGIEDRLAADSGADSEVAAEGRGREALAGGEDLVGFSEGVVGGGAGDPAGLVGGDERAALGVGQVD